MKQIYIESYFKGFKKLSNYSLLANHPQKDIIEKRIRIIKFFDIYGKEATKEAFSVSRSTVFLWKKRLREAKGSLIALAPKSRAPKRKRNRQTHPAICEFIKDYRTIHPGVGKDVIKPELDEYCQRKGIASISESTVGRLIKELKEKNLIPNLSSKLSYNARQDKFILKTRKKRKKLRRKGYHPQKPGDLVQLDSITLFLCGVKRYLLTAIDVKTGFGFAYAYKSLSSLKAADFIQKLQTVAPFKVERVQTDNGGEFEKHFRKYIERESIIHFHNYPRHPQSNAQVERFNRTVQEQYVRWHLDELYDAEEFNRGLMEYLIWYNTKKPHRSLNRLPPLRYYLNNFIDDAKQSNMSWTLTTT